MRILTSMAVGVILALIQTVSQDTIMVKMIPMSRIGE